MNKTVKSVALIVCLVAFLISLFSTPLTQAVSATTTGLVTTDFDRNVGKYLVLGGFDIYCFDNKLVFYNPDATLEKTWSIPSHYTLNSGAEISVNMVAVNATHLFLTETYTKNVAPTYTLICEKYVVNVDSLAYSYNAIELGDYAGQSMDGTVFNAGTNFFVVMGLDSTHRVLIAKFVGADATTCTTDYVSISDAGLYASTIYVVSADNSTAYVFGLAADADFRINLFKCTLGTLNIETAGNSGAADSYGEHFNYFGGYLEHNGYYDVLLSFGYTDTSEAYKIEVARFNATYFEILASAGSSATTTGDLRVLGVTSASLTSFNALTDGLYLVLYLDTLGALRYSSYNLVDLNTVSPDLTGGGSVNVSFQGLILLMGGSTDRGGMVNAFSTVVLMVDYSGSRCAVEVITPLAASLTITKTWVPTPVYETSDLVQLLGSSTYTYTIHIEVNGVYAQGYINAFNNDTLLLVSSKTFDANGNIVFSFITTTVATDINYYFECVLTNFQATTSWELEVLTLSAGVSPTSYPFPTNNPYPTVPGGGGGGGVLDGTTINYNLNIFVNFFLLFICIVAPAIILGVMAGVVGFLGGGVLGLGVGVLAGLLPFWFIFLVGLALVAVLFYGRQQSQKSGGAIDG